MNYIDTMSSLYIENIFTKILKKEVPVDFLQETEFTVVISDKFPQAKVHLLVLPKRECVNLQDFLNLATSDEILDYFSVIKDQLNKLHHAKVVFNNGKLAGQEIMHLHCHIMSEVTE